MNRNVDSSLACVLTLVAVLCPSRVQALDVQIATNGTEDLRPWAEEAEQLMQAWNQRLVNLLPSEGFQPPGEVRLVIRRSDQGVAGTRGRTITVSSHWIEKHPEDIGLVIHELVHVVQAYPPGSSFWITEGIADYLRWAIYEGKPQEWFPRPNEERGYRRGYRVAGGFLLWLESGPAPGIVNKLNRALRAGEYKPELFKEATGKTLDELWSEYASRRGDSPRR